MLPTTTRDRQRVVPVGSPDDPAAPTYWIVPLDKLRLAHLDASIEAQGARLVPTAEVRRRLRDELRRLCSPETAGPAIEHIDQLEALDEEIAALADVAERRAAEERIAERDGLEPPAPDPKATDDAAVLAAKLAERDAIARDVVEYQEFAREHSPAFARLLAVGALYLRIAPIQAFRFGCVGWEQVPDAPAWRVGLDRLVPVDLLSELPAGHAELVGWQCMLANRLPSERRKN